MTLLELLRQELPKRGGWPEGVREISTHASGRVFFDGRCAPQGFTLPKASDAWNKHEHPYTYTNAVTRGQYEAALAASKEPLTGTGVDGWIDWPGGECPVEKGTLVDVRYRNGEENHHVGAGISFDRTGSNPDNNAKDWNNDGSSLDIISYRLHQPQQTEQPEVSEEDLNECIGQAPVTEWNGEGLPQVGCECESKQFAQIDWHKFRVVAIENGHVFGFWNDKVGVCLDSNHWEFRPLRTEAERAIDEMVRLSGVSIGAAKILYDTGYRK